MGCVLVGIFFPFFQGAGGGGNEGKKRSLWPKNETFGGRSTCGRELMASKKVVPAPDATDQKTVVRFYATESVDV